MLIFSCRINLAALGQLLHCMQKAHGNHLTASSGIHLRISTIFIPINVADIMRLVEPVAWKKGTEI